MKVLLIDIACTTLDEVWPSVEHPLGLMYLASAAREALGSSVTMAIRSIVVRSADASRARGDTFALLDALQPDVVGIRSLSIGQDSLRIVADTVKEWNPRCPVLAGGPHATDAPEEVLRASRVDLVVQGEGEASFSEVLAAIRDGRPLEGIPGTVALTEGRVLRGGPRALLPVGTIPRPDYSLINLDAFSNQFLTFSSKVYQRHANILSSRGCPYRCAYCHNILGKAFRARSPEDVVDEILWLADTHGIRDFQFIDDIFNLDRERTLAICDRIIASGRNFSFSFPNGVRGDRMDDALIDRMAAMGTRFISFAVETASPRLQRMIHKNLDLDEVRRAISHATSVGIITRGFFMLGFPSETLEEAEATVEYARASDLCGATFFTVVCFPGTDLYRIARSMGYFEHDSADVRRDYVQVGAGPYAFDAEQLVRLKRKAISEFAFTRTRIERALSLLPRYFTPREIDGFFMAYVVSSGLSENDVTDPFVRRFLHRHFLVAERFSRQRSFYV